MSLGGRYVPDFLQDIPQGPSVEAQTELLLAEKDALIAELRAALVAVYPYGIGDGNWKLAKTIDDLLEKTK